MPNSPIEKSPDEVTAGAVLVSHPSLTAAFPTPPAGFVPTSAAEYRGLLPKLAEVSALPQAVDELRLLGGDYVSLFGKAAAAAQPVLAALDAASQWSRSRRAAEEWAAYARVQEGLAWKGARRIVEGMKRPFDLAAAHDPSVLTSYPGLARLLGVGKDIAKRALAARRRKAKAEGPSATPVTDAKPIEKPTA